MWDSSCAYEYFVQHDDEYVGVRRRIDRVLLIGNNFGPRVSKSNIFPGYRLSVKELDRSTDVLDTPTQIIRFEVSFDLVPATQARSKVVLWDTSKFAKQLSPSIAKFHQ